MKAKFDKDTLIKHRFWILLGITVPLVLGAVFILITTVSAEIESFRKKAADKYNTLTKMSAPAGPQVIDARSKIARDWKEKETDVHRIAFEAQAPLFIWPRAIEDQFDFQNGKFVTEIKIIGDAPAKESWPEDNENLFHGTVKVSDENYLIVNGRKGDSKFYRSFKMKLSRQQPKEGEREPQWFNVSPNNFVAITYYSSKYFYDPLTDAEQRVYVNNYKSQIHPILQIVDPVDARGNGTVQFNGWLYKPNEYPPEKAKFFTFVSKEWDANNFIFEEAWMAQEDLWIQRELFRMIRAANDDVAVCKAKIDGKPAEEGFKGFEGKDKPAVFANPNFELKFEWEEGDRLMVTVKNMLPRRQKLDVQFRVKFNKSPNIDLSSEVILLDGEPLDPNGTKKDSLKKEIPLEKGRIQRTGIYGVEQLLTWETAPVKRIDNVSIGSPSGEIAHSHKTYPQSSQPFRKDPKKEEAVKTDAGPMGGIAAPKFGAGGGGEGQQGQANFGVNGVLIDRYLEVSEQSRRLPVGLALIVDQDHIGRVLTAFNNSRLRFLTMQVLLNRYPQSVRPQLTGGTFEPEGGREDDAPPPLVVGPKVGPMGSGFTPPRGGSSLGPPKGFGSSVGPPKGFGSSVGPPKGFGPGPMQPMPPVGPGQNVAVGAAANLGGGEELENNVEVVIYGIVTLYERYPKRKIQPDAK